LGLSAAAKRADDQARLITSAAPAGAALSATSDLEAAAAELVPRAQRGDVGARDGLLRACRDTIYRWALVQTGDAEDAEDVTQEVLIRLYGSLDRYAGRSRFTTWLYRVTHNEAANLGRRLRARLRLAEGAARESAAEAAPASDPLERLHAGKVAALAKVLLRGLPRRQREVFHLADIEGRTAEEISERLGMSPVTARVHLLHARRTLRTRILERWPELGEEAR
jgi:RNA polymerase sigma-70 factor (ECF subfamily)